MLSNLNCLSCSLDRGHISMRSSEGFAGLPKLKSQAFMDLTLHTQNSSALSHSFLFQTWMECYPAGVESVFPSATRGLDDTTWQCREICSPWNKL